jgi:exodeoxyribonuclease V alpha subunit
LESITQTIKTVTFKDKSSEFCILKTKEGNSVTGPLNNPRVGSVITCKGDWKTHKVHGKQFEAKSISVSLPTKKNNVNGYLASGVFKGIGDSLAKRIINKFGDCFVEEMNSGAPDLAQKLASVKGISQKKADEIILIWNTNKDYFKVTEWLDTHGVPQKVYDPIFKKFGNTTQEQIEMDPYILMDIQKGVSFSTVDHIAWSITQEMQPEAPRQAFVDAPKRLRKLITQSLYAHSFKTGSTCCPMSEVYSIARGLCSEHSSDEIQKTGSLYGHKVRDSFYDVIEVKAYYNSATKTALSLKRFRLAELSIYNKLIKMRRTKPAFHIAKSLDKYSFSIPLNDEQKQAVEYAITKKISAITGGAGVGKTSIIKAICNILDAENHGYTLCAPTGKAAKRLSEATGKEAFTIHRLLGLGMNDSNKQDFDGQLDTPMLIVDECSMIDCELAAILLNSVDTKCRVVFVGDPNQLPSVGAGRFFADFIDSGKFRVTHLKTIYRQKETNMIIPVAHSINNGLYPDMQEADTVEDMDKVLEKGIDVVNLTPKSGEGIKKQVYEILDYFKKEGVDIKKDLQILSPMKRGEYGVNTLNNIVQQYYHSEDPNITLGFKKGDKVMQTKNNYDYMLFNGDFLVIKEINKNTQVFILEMDGTEYILPYDEMKTFSLAYACTVHKVQGAAFPVVVMFVTSEHEPLLYKNIMYTGVTRAKDTLVLVSQKQALSTAIQRCSQNSRITSLKCMLDYFDPEQPIRGKYGALKTLHEPKYST